MTSERQAYIYVQLPGTLDTVPAALLKVEKLPDGTFVGRFRYGDRYLERKDAIAFDPFQLPLGNTVHEFTKLKGIPGAVRDAAIEDGNRLWIGKFPEKADRCNLQRVEYATLELARRCGIAVCNASLQSVAAHDVLMLERFDREYTGGAYLRFGLVSGLTMLDCDDNYPERERWSYPLLADQLRRWSEKPDADRVELFRRVVFNAAVTNNDDHPRNHAVLRTARGWRLTPAYDLVPAPLASLERRDLAMTVGTYGRTASIYNLISQCERYGLTAEAAGEKIEKIVTTVRTWRDHFRACGVSAKDVEYMAQAFLPDCFFFEKPVDALK